MPRPVLHLLVYGLYAAAEARGGPAPAPLLVHEAGKVVDMSLAAAREGVVPGQRLRQAEHHCPGIKRVEMEEANYRDRVRAFREVVAAASPRVEPLGNREVLADLTGVPTPAKVARQLAVKLAERPGLLVAAGLGNSRLVARIAGRQAGDALLAHWQRKRNSLPALQPRLLGDRAALASVVPGQEAAYLAPLDLGQLWTLPPELIASLAHLGFARIGDLARVPETQLFRRFGPLGSLAARSARGIDPQPVAALYPPVEVVERLAFEAGVEPGSALEGVVGVLARSAGHRLEAAGLGTLEVRLRLEAVVAGQRANSFRRRSFSRPQGGPSTLEPALRHLLGEAVGELARTFSATCLVEAVVAEFTELRPVSLEQLSFLAEGASTAAATEGRGARLDQVLAALGQRYPKAALRLGRDLPVSRREWMLRYFDPLRRSH
ncbi:MAG: hypothetical protein M1602_04125 [Firmicutes bacterium]|nr:hypothetical protein [Bacillota bacterium]